MEVSAALCKCFWIVAATVSTSWIADCVEEDALAEAWCCYIVMQTAKLTVPLRRTLQVAARATNGLIRYASPSVRLQGRLLRR
jgi:hypothetical protein